MSPNLRTCQLLLEIFSSFDVANDILVVAVAAVAAVVVAVAVAVVDDEEDAFFFFLVGPRVKNLTADVGDDEGDVVAVVVAAVVVVSGDVNDGHSDLEGR